jgi:hypothetical protein
MDRLNSSRGALSVFGAALLLAGCGGSQLSAASIGSPQPAAHLQWYGRLRVLSAEGPERMPLTARSRSPIPRAMRRTSPDLWYLSNFYSSVIDAYTVRGLKYVYSISGLAAPQGMCTVGKKNFWVANSGADDLLEFSYRGVSPIKTLTVAGTPLASCAVDPTTGNIAALTLNGPGVFIWKRAKGSPTRYIVPSPCESVYFAGYDDRENLFADCYDTNGQGGLFELPKGASAFERLYVNQSIGFPGGVQWDGKYLAVGDQNSSPNAIYRFSCAGSTCTNKGTVSLEGTVDCVQAWIQKAIVVCDDYFTGDAYVWHYPTGGSSFESISGVGSAIASVIVR